MKTEYIKKLIDESHDLMLFTMSMQMCTKYKGNPKFSSAQFSRTIQEARKEVDEIIKK